MSYIGYIYNEVVKKFEEPIASNAKAIAMAVQPLVMSCFLLYVLFLVYKLYNNKDFVFEEIINAMLLFAVIGTFTYGGSYYYDYVIPFVTGAGDDISSKFVGVEGSSVSVIEAIFETYDKPINTLYDQLIKELKGWSLSSIPTYGIPIIFLWICKIIFTLMIVVNLLISKVMVTLLLSVGIIFFCFAIFPSTRNLFTTFVGSALNYTLLNIMYCLAASLTANMVETTVLKKSSLGAAALAGAAMEIFISTVIIVLSIKEIPKLVSGLTGGVSIEHNGYLADKAKDAAGAVAGLALRGAGRGVGKLGRSAGGKLKGGINGTWNKFRGNGGVKGA